MYRLFVAIDPPETTREELLRICYGLPNCRWHDKDQIHVTLRFIGEVDGGVFRDIQDALSNVKAEPFDVMVKSVGFFPPRKDPEILWAGIDNRDGIVSLRNKIENCLSRAGIPSEGRKFFPHISLARLKGTPPTKVAQFLSEYSLFQLDPFHVREFSLYSSFLSSERALHQVEATYPLITKRRVGI
jgi:2'-5' RNA ligase